MQSETTRASYERRLNSKQIMCFRIDIECAAAQGSSTTTTTWDSRPRDRCDSCAEKDHDGSAPVKEGREELIKLVQLLIRWKAFNLDNLLTT